MMLQAPGLAKRLKSNDVRKKCALLKRVIDLLLDTGVGHRRRFLYKHRRRCFGDVKESPRTLKIIRNVKIVFTDA
jgi:hypothetical protein